MRDAGYTHPIVALTANADDQERRRCYAAGCNGFLAKPMDQEELPQTMRRYLRPNISTGSTADDDQPDPSADSQFVLLRESFQAELPSRIAEIGTATSRDDLIRVADLTHQLKGTAGCFGLDAVAADAAALHAATGLPESRERIHQCFQTLTEQTEPSGAAKAA